MFRLQIMEELADTIDSLNERFHEINDAVKADKGTKTTTIIGNIERRTERVYTYWTNHIDIDDHWNLVLVDTGSTTSTNELPSNRLPRGSVTFSDCIPLTSEYSDIDGTKIGTGYALCKNSVDYAILTDNFEDQRQHFIGPTLLSTIQLHDPTPKLEFRASITNIEHVICQRSEDEHVTIASQFEVSDKDFIETHSNISYSPSTFHGFRYMLTFDPLISIRVAFNVIHGDFQFVAGEQTILTDASTFANGSQNSDIGYFFRFHITTRHKVESSSLTVIMVPMD